MAKKKSFYIEGIFHNVLVKVVTQKWLAKYSKDKGIMGYYEHEDAKIYVVKELTPPVKEHTLYHEISHHIIETLDGVEEEHKCDTLSSYLMRLTKQREYIEKNLADEDKK